MAAAQNNGGGGITNTINNINKTTVFDKAKNLANKVVDSPLTAFIDPRSKLALAMGGYKYLRDGVTPFQQKSIDEELESIQTKGGIVPYADGGRAGYVSGGAALKLLEKGKEGIASLYSAGKGKFDEFVETMSQSKKPSESFTSQNITTDLIDGPITVEKMANLDSKTLDIIKNTYDNGLYKEMPEILKAGNLLERFTKVVKGERIVDYERAESILGVPLKGDETLNEIFKIEFNTRPVEKLADGGRVGLFMGGDPLDGQALSIYNSMNAYGFSEQEIANALQEQGLYTAPGNGTPDAPDTTPGQTYGLQSGSDNFSPYNPDPNSIKSVKQDPAIQANLEAIQRNQQLQSMGIQDPFANEMDPANAYYGDMPTDTSNQIGTQSMFAKAKQGLTGLMDNPLVNLISSSTPFGMLKNVAKGIGSKMPVNQRAIQENIMGNLGFAVNDIGQIVSTGDYNDPNNVMAGYNLNRMTVDTFKNRIDKIRNRKIAQTDASRRRIEAIQEAQRQFEAAEKLKRLAVEEANLRKGKAPGGGTWQGGGGAAYTNPDTGVGGGTFTNSNNQQDYQDAYDPGGGEKDGGVIGYRNGGLATMFTRRR